MRLLALILFTSYILSSVGQVSIGIIGEPTLNLTAVGDEPKSSGDSIRILKSHDYTIGLGINIRNQIDRYNAITVIPSFLQTNVLLERQNLQFLDVVHPLLPEIRDFSQAAEKKAFLRYRQQYVGIQILYANRLKAKLPDAKFSLEIGGGLAGYYLMKSDVKIRTEAFAINGQYIHTFSDSTGVESRNYLVNLIGTADLNYKLTPNIILLAGLKLGIPLTSTSISEPTLTVFTPGLRVGFRHFL